MMGLTQDLRYAVRTLKHSPGYTLVALLTLALGIGANTAIFSMIRGVLLRPLPYREGERLVFLEQPASLAGVQDARFSVPELADYRSQSRSLEGIVEYHSMPFILLGDGEPSRVQTGVVSANFFDVLGVTPHLGRAFREGEDQAGANPVLMLSYGYWMNQLGGDPAVIGRTFEMNDRIHTVIGVLPPRAAVSRRERRLHAGVVLSLPHGPDHPGGPHGPDAHPLRPAGSRPDGPGRQHRVRGDRRPGFAPSIRRRIRRARASPSAWPRCRRRWAAARGRRCSCCSARPGSSCSSPAPTWPT